MDYDGDDDDRFGKSGKGSDPYNSLLNQEGGYTLVQQKSAGGRIQSHCYFSGMIALLLPFFI